jgi:putative FmdB family regulatory protein
VPLYEYECTKCHRKTEKIENVSGPHLKKCPHCGGKVERVLAAPAIQFKGSGWYVTDYAGKKNSGGDSAAPATKAESGDAKESATKEPAAKESKEKKPAKKKE